MYATLPIGSLEKRPFPIWVDALVKSTPMKLGPVNYRGEDKKPGSSIPIYARIDLHHNKDNDSYKTWLYNDNNKSPEDEGSNNLEFVRGDQGMPFGKRLRCQTINGNPSEIEITIIRNDEQDWEVLVDETSIGYWPKSNYEVNSANEVAWGGEIVNRRTRGRHTSTQMGSGHFSTDDLGTVAYIRKMALYDLDMDLYYPPEEYIDISMNNGNCYDATYWDLREADDDDDFGHYITMGGPVVPPMKNLASDLTAYCSFIV
ncbi:hypothetical protein EJ110_NYTH20791 [Nymphaea thermarum]|nr:hypothetical protein EJ110_NYTH20791 [Nymphaea thermarum]